ncbi:MAG: DUF421 domain-containing protein [Syntrophomonadaceae bacterium]|nr:DUF421 domain-containing protein [Syntrophomonadaceae bacterium]
MESYLTGALQSLITFAAILFLGRLLNKEQLAQLTFFDWVIGVTIGSIGAELATDTQGLTWNYLWVLVVFVAAAMFTGYVTQKSRPLRKIIDGEPTVVIQNGKILEHNMKKLRYNIDNLFDQLRNKSVFDIDDVEFAVLESNGGLSVLLKSQQRPVTPADLNIPTEYEGLSSEIIMDGVVIYQNLQQNDLDEQWLIAELRKRGYESPQEIVFAGLSSDGSLYIDERDDQMPHMTDISD